MVKREPAVRLAEHVLRNLHDGQEDWPLSLVNEVYVFGSFARGALSPHDLDIDVEHENDDKWCSHFVTSLAYGRDPNAPMRQLLATGQRGCQFTFNFREQADFELTLLWRRGDSLATALKRLHAIKADPAAGRAPRDSMGPLRSCQQQNHRAGPRRAIRGPDNEPYSRRTSCGPVEALESASPGGQGGRPLLGAAWHRSWSLPSSRS